MRDTRAPDDASGPRSRLPLGAALLAVLLGGLPATAAAQAQLPPSGFEEGQAVPTRAFPSADDGDPVSLAEYRGHKLILHVFASW